MHPSVLKAGAGAAIVGSILGFIFNILHPRGPGFEGDAHLRVVAGSEIWVFDHYMLFWAVGISVVGLIVIGLSFDQQPAASWGRIAAGWAVISGAVGMVLLMIDGVALRVAAEAAGQSPQGLAAASAVDEITLSLFTGLMLTFFGVTPVLYGIAVLTSAEHPGWLGYLAVASGLVGLLAGSISYLDGVSALTANVLFPIGSVAFTLWGLLMGVRLWKRSGEVTAPTTKAAEAPG